MTGVRFSSISNVGEGKKKSEGISKGVKSQPVRFVNNIPRDIVISCEFEPQEENRSYLNAKRLLLTEQSKHNTIYRRFSAKCLHFKNGGS